MNARLFARYSRHLLMPEVGLAGQERLMRARVLVVGAGGLGAPALQYLGAAGVGQIGIVDDDVVDESNLQRQTLFTQAQIGARKADVAAQRIADQNPYIDVASYPVRLDARNARELIAHYDMVLDCTDRFSTRYLINDACFFENKPDIYASIFRFDGQVTIFERDHGPCYRCLFPSAPPPGSVPTCAEGGVLGVLPGIVGAWQANEALKLILQIGTPARGRLLLIDALGASMREVRFTRDAGCALCGDAPHIDAPVADEPGEEAPLSDDVTADQLDACLTDATLLDVREPHEAVLGAPEGAISLPASQLEARLHELDTARTYVVACRVGVKSRWAFERLRAAGFRRIRHLRGGLFAYAAIHDGFLFF